MRRGKESFHFPPPSTRNAATQKAESCRRTGLQREHYLPAADSSCPRVFRHVFKEALRPKNKPLEKQLPSWTRETRHAAGQAARGRLQSTRAKVPPALGLTPPSPLEVESGVCQPPRRPNCSPLGWKSQGGHSLQRAGVCRSLSTHPGGRDSAPRRAVPTQAGHCHPHIQPGH